MPTKTATSYLCSIDKRLNNQHTSYNEAGARRTGERHQVQGSLCLDSVTAWQIDGCF
ncbi:MAG: hypothetical protein WCJ56_11955 [bacterium]